MRFKDSAGRKIVSTATAETVGKVRHFVVEPETRRVVAVRVKKAEGDLLRWADIVGFGADAVTVSDAARITGVPDELASLAGKDKRMLGKRVLSALGDDLGPLTDVEFDPDSGQLLDLIIGDLVVPAVRLIGVGSYAVVVAAA